MLKCNDESFYFGYATDLDRRVKEHNESNTLGAKYTRGRRPVELVYHEEYETRSEAQKREYAFKKLTRSEKEKLIK